MLYVPSFTHQITHSLQDQLHWIIDDRIRACHNFMTLVPASSKFKSRTLLPTTLYLPCYIFKYLYIPPRMPIAE